jgi:hypothetical protein
MALEGQEVAAWVVATLKADTGANGISTLLGGRIYRDQVPQRQALPAATVSLVSHVDENTVGGRRVFAVTLVDVRVIGDGGQSYQNQAAGRVDTVLQSAAGTRNGVTVVELRRDQLQAFVENTDGVSTAHVIQTFRTEAYSSV